MLSPNGPNSIVVRLIVVVDVTVIEVLVASVVGVILSTRPIIVVSKQKDYGFTHLILYFL